MSLNLDKRQRAMLREMGVRVWQAEPPPEAGKAEMVGEVREGAPPPSTRQALPTPWVSARTPTPAPATPPATSPATSPAVSTVTTVRAATTATALSPRPDPHTLDWAALQSAVAECRACALCESRKNPVWGVGPVPSDATLAPAVDWLIVGEAPVESEDSAGQPLVGQEGELLNNMLRAVGLQRGGAGPDITGLSRRVFITNVLKCRPPAQRKPEPTEVAQCAPYLQRQIALLQPRVIVVMGKFAANALLQSSVPDVQKIPLDKLRGQIYAYCGVPVVVTYHPDSLLRNLPDKAKAWDDLCLARDQVNRPSTSHQAAIKPPLSQR